MEMNDTGVAISGGAIGAIATVAMTYIKAKFYGSRRKSPEQVAVTPDPLRVEIQKTYATKEELRDLEDRFERKLDKTLDSIKEDITSLRVDIRENDQRAEARAVATHKRIDTIKDMCAARGACK